MPKQYKAVYAMGNLSADDPDPKPKFSCAGDIEQSALCDIAAVLGLIIITLVPYAQTATFDFVNFDDPVYVSDNDLVLHGLSWAAVGKSFTQFHSANWHPLVWLSFMAEVECFGVNAGAMHITNVILHVCNAILLYIWLRVSRQDILRSSLATVLFAVHPAHVESVAWITERKDVLCTFFMFLALIAYSKYAGTGSKGWYYGSIGVFALGLTAKATLVTFPVVLFLLDYWPLCRIRFRTPELGDAPWVSVLLEKIPFFVLSAAISLITIAAQKSGGAMSDLAALSLSDRICNAVVAYFRYCWMSVWPFNLWVFYPLPENGWHGSVILLAALFLVLISLYCMLRRISRPALLVGWLWFLITLVPVIGLVQVGIQSLADRYLYIPMIGLSLMLLWNVPDRWLVLSGRSTAVLVTGIASLIIVCTMQVGVWRNSITLFESSLTAVPERNTIAYQNLSLAYNQVGRYEDALDVVRPQISKYSTDAFL